MVGNRPEILAIIPARGGSKGIPRKNLLPIGGKPMLAHSIEQARNAPAVGRIVVSTDDPEIAAVAAHFGAESLSRPPEISGDTASSESALLHAIDYLKQKDGYEPDLVVFLQPTSPRRETGEIQTAIETFFREDADSLFSACRVEGFTWRIEGDSLSPVNYNPLKRPRRQDLPEEIWEENGSIYVFRPWVLRELGSRLGGKIAMHRMDRLSSFQIDEPGDFELLEHLMGYRNEKQKAESRKQKLGERDEGENLKAEWSRIKLLVLDFDGVMTDNRVLVTEDGREGVFCDRGDGLGIGLVKQAGVEVLVLSKEKNNVVAARCRKLGVECIQGCDEKLAALQKWSATRGLGSEQIAYVGNDVNDLDCLGWVGLPIAVGDAVQAVQRKAKFITQKMGGYGAVREVTDLLVASNPSFEHMRD